MDTTKTQKRSRAELLQAIATAKAELEDLNMFRHGDEVVLSGTVQGYADELGTVVLKVEGSEETYQLDESCLKKVLSGADAQLKNLERRCSALLHENNLPPASGLAAIEAVVRQAELGQTGSPVPELVYASTPNGTGDRASSRTGNGSNGHENPLNGNGYGTANSSTGTGNGNSEIYNQIHKQPGTETHYNLDNASHYGNTSTQPGTTIYVVVRRDTLEPATRFDLKGKEFFNGYLNLKDCEAYRKECEDRETAWGVRGGAYKVLSFNMSPAEDN